MCLHGVLRKGSAYVELGAHFVSLLYCYVKITVNLPVKGLFRDLFNLQ